MSVEDFIINVYCLVDEKMKKIPKIYLRQRGPSPNLSDSEIITMEIVSEFQGIDTDKGAWEYFTQHWLALFPTLGSRANYAKHASNLWGAKQWLQTTLASELGVFTDSLHMSDGLPMPICHFKRANRSRLYNDVPAYGYCASKGETYYGFKGNVVINSEGVLTAITITPANIDERESLWDMVNNFDGLLIADKGLIGQAYKQELQQYANIDLQTAVRANMKETRSPSFIKWLKSTRRLVETVIGQLTERFNIEKVRARKLVTLTNRIARKVLSHTAAALINKKIGNPVLQFDSLISN